MKRSQVVLVLNEEEEAKQVRRDLMTVVLLNGFFLAILFALYFFNRATGKVDHFFSSLLKF